MDKKRIKNGGRETNYDLLRCASCIAVILLHVSSTFLNAYTSDSTFGRLYLNNIGVTCIYNSLTRFAVPCFVMLSGAFNLSNPNNADFKYYYRKSIKNVGIHVVAFTIYYFVFSASLIVLSPSKTINDIKAVLFQTLQGNPYYHMWYMYMLIGLYIATPLLLNIFSHFPQATIAKVVYVFLVFASIGAWTSKTLMYWDIGLSFRYLGYYMLGYEIRKNCNNKPKDNRKAVMYIATGILIELLVGYIQYRMELHGYGLEEQTYSIMAPYAPWIVLTYVLIFTGFSKIEIKKSPHILSEFSRYIFFVYLFHAGIWNVFLMIIKRLFGTSINSNILIPVMTGCVLVVALIASVVYEKIWKIIENKSQLSYRIYKLIFKEE